MNASGDEPLAFFIAPLLRYNALMGKPDDSPFPFPPKRHYMGRDISMRLIRRYAQAIADEFKPEKIVLFGSQAWGERHEYSDVDLMVVMPTKNPHSQAVRIHWRLAAPFPLDLLVRSPEDVASRLEDGESFMTTVMTQGKVLYEKGHKAVGTKGGARLRRRRAGLPGRRVPS
jgi:predicted nucleotidyltransferase